jgi:hypothetical protein
VEPELEPLLEPELGLGSEPLLEPELELGPEPLLEPELELGPEPLLEPEPEPEPLLEPALEPLLEPEPDPEPELLVMPSAPSLPAAHPTEIAAASPRTASTPRIVASLLAAFFNSGSW